MKVTKYEHACLVLELNGEKVIIDPGFYTRPIEGETNVKAIVITHKHDDHCFEEQIDRILKNNPDALIFGTDEVIERIAPRKATAVHHGDFYEVGEFSLEFFGDCAPINERGRRDFLVLLAGDGNRCVEIGRAHV